MCIRTLNEVITTKAELSVSEFALAIVLAWHKHHKTGVCNPGERRLASETHMNRRSLRKVRKRLIKDGGISVVQAGRGTLTPHYELHLDRLASGRRRRPQTTGGSGRPGRPQTISGDAASGRPGDTLVGADVHASGRPGRPNRSRKIFESKKPPTAVHSDAPKIVPFNVHAAVAKRALEDELKATKGGDPDLGNVRERYKQLMADQNYRYDAESVQKAVDAVWVAWKKAKARFDERIANHGRGRAHA